MESFKKGHQRSASAYGFQVGILSAILLAYCLGTILYMGSWVLVGAGIALPFASGYLGRATSAKTFLSIEPPTVWALGTFALFMVSIAIQFPVTSAAAALVAINSFVLVGAWAVHRFPPKHEARPLALAPSLLNSTLMGVGMAVVVGLFATVIFCIGAFSGDATFNFQNWCVLMLAYVAAGLLGGILVGLLRPLMPYPLGRMLIGIPVVALIYGFVGIAMVVMGIGDGPETLREALLMGAGIGVIAGPMGALTFEGGVSPDELKYQSLKTDIGAL